MARTSLRLVSLPLLGFVVACATAVDQGFVEDDSGDDTGGSQSSSQGGLSSSGGQLTDKGGQPPTGSAGKPPAAFGGTSSSGAGGMPGSAGAPAGGSSSGTAGKTGAGGNASAGTGSGGSGSGGTSTGSGGKANGGAGGTSGSAGAGGKAGSGGTSSAGSSNGGSGGSGGGSPSTGDCAAANSGWVVQYWTSTPAAELPGADLRIFNNAGGTVNFNTLELRHYFTNEDPTLSFIFSTFGHNFPGAPYYESEGGANVLSSIQAVSPAVANASHYISIKFNATPGNFGNGEDAQLGFYGSITAYPRQSNQANDYTYIGHPTNDPGSANRNTGWDRITLYAGGKLVWGCEP